MATNERDRQVLRALAAACQKHHDLIGLLSFYYDLYQVQFEAKAEIPALRPRDDLAARWRLEGGIPQLSFDQLAIDPPFFANLVSRVRRVLVQHNPEWTELQKKYATEDLLALARTVFETWDTLTSPGPAPTEDGVGQSRTPLALTVGFALAPYLYQASETILPDLDLELWVYGYCPVCGGQPNLALLEAKRGARQLLCSRCNSLWHYSRLGCPFCKSKEKQSYYAGEDGVYRLYVCHTCKRYLKTMDLREVHRDVYPLVERLVMVGMDLAAQQEGYGR